MVRTCFVGEWGRACGRGGPTSEALGYGAAASQADGSGVPIGTFCSQPDWARVGGGGLLRVFGSVSMASGDVWCWCSPGKEKACKESK